MEKKFISRIAIIAVIVTVAAINVNLSLQSGELPNITLSEITAGANWFTDGIENTLQGQGWTKDERERVVECQQGTNSSSWGASISVTHPSGATGSVGVSGSSSTPAGTTKITCPNGHDNCTPTEC
jgi:hypothetical protein